MISTTSPEYGFCFRFVDQQGEPPVYQITEKIRPSVKAIEGRRAFYLLFFEA